MNVSTPLPSSLESLERFKNKYGSAETLDVLLSRMLGHGVDPQEPLLASDLIVDVLCSGASTLICDITSILMCLRKLAASGRPLQREAACRSLAQLLRMEACMSEVEAAIGGERQLLDLLTQPSVHLKASPPSQSLIRGGLRHLLIGSRDVEVATDIAHYLINSLSSGPEGKEEGALLITTLKRVTINGKEGKSVKLGVTQLRNLLDTLGQDSWLSEGDEVLITTRVALVQIAASALSRAEAVLTPDWEAVVRAVLDLVRVKEVQHQVIAEVLGMLVTLDAWKGEGEGVRRLQVQLLVVLKGDCLQCHQAQRGSWSLPAVLGLIHSLLTISSEKEPHPALCTADSVALLLLHHLGLPGQPDQVICKALQVLAAHIRRCPSAVTHYLDHGLVDIMMHMSVPEEMGLSTLSALVAILEALLAHPGSVLKLLEHNGELNVVLVNLLLKDQVALVPDVLGILREASHHPRVVEAYLLTEAVLSQLTFYLSGQHEICRSRYFTDVLEILNNLKEGCGDLVGVFRQYPPYLATVQHLWCGIARAVKSKEFDQHLQTMLDLLQHFLSTTLFDFEFCFTPANVQVLHGLLLQSHHAGGGLSHAVAKPALRLVTTIINRCPKNVNTLHEMGTKACLSQLLRLLAEDMDHGPVTPPATPGSEPESGAQDRESLILAALQLADKFQVSKKLDGSCGLGPGPCSSDITARHTVSTDSGAELVQWPLLIDLPGEQPGGVKRQEVEGERPDARLRHVLGLVSEGQVPQLEMALKQRHSKSSRPRRPVMDDVTATIHARGVKGVNYMTYQHPTRKRSTKAAAGMCEITPFYANDLDFLSDSEVEGARRRGGTLSQDGLLNGGGPVRSKSALGALMSMMRLKH